MDTHPSNLASLRIDCPFDELTAHAESVDFEQLDSMEHGNVPFVVILVRALAEWKKTVRQICDCSLIDCCERLIWDSSLVLTARRATA